MSKTTLMQSAATAVLLGALLVVGAQAEFVTDTTPVPPPGTPGSPTPGLSPAQLDQWLRGRRVFDRDIHYTDGLGSPDYNGDSCRGCHDVPAIGGAGRLDRNVFRFANDNGGAGPFTNLTGGQIGSRLRRFDFPGREDHDPASDVFEQRNSPSILGLGLFETIPDSAILANEDPTDANGDGIFGMARMINVAGGPMEVGKLGLKAHLPRLEDFVKGAMINELGVTVSANPRGFGTLMDTDGIPDPELTPSDEADLVFYLQNLAPPARAGSTNPLVALGEQVFSQIGCSTCHLPSLPGTAGPVPAYTNLLLHDIWGPGFRGMEDPGADVGFYRTAPLWGVSTTGPWMHDGRAETLLDAILLHGGEAATVRTDFLNLSTGERDAVILFLEDL